MAFQGKNTANPDGFANILTKKGRKYAEKKLGSDFIAHPMEKHKNDFYLSGHIHEGINGDYTQETQISEI